MKNVVLLFLVISKISKYKDRQNAMQTQLNYKMKGKGYIVARGSKSKVGFELYIDLGDFRGRMIFNVDGNL